jgi:hypothetical protein
VTGALTAKIVNERICPESQNKEDGCCLSEI